MTIYTPDGRVVRRAIGFESSYRIERDADSCESLESCVSGYALDVSPDDLQDDGSTGGDDSEL